MVDNLIKNKNKKMKKPGLIGGVGPESTIDYYRLIINEFKQLTQSDNYPELIVNSVNLTDVLNFVAAGQYNQLTNYMVQQINILEKAGVSFVAISSNTPHIVFDDIAQKVNIELVSIVEQTCKVISELGFKKVALFGTKSTMTMGFYNSCAAKYGFEIVVPNTADIDYIHQKYMQELVFNNINSVTKSKLIAIANNIYNQQNIDGLILGGTELPLILNQTDFNYLKVFNTTQIHVSAIVSKMLS